ALLESGCFDPASRAEALANFAAGPMNLDYGVPLDIPKLPVVRDGEAIVPTSTAGSGSGPGEFRCGGDGGTVSNGHVRTGDLAGGGRTGAGQPGSIGIGTVSGGAAVAPAPDYGTAP